MNENILRPEKKKKAPEWWEYFEKHNYDPNNNWKCLKDCKGKCCGVVPIPEEIFLKHAEKIQRDVVEVMPFRTGNLYITEDLTCTFLNDEGRCEIYEDRPNICVNYGLHEVIPCPYIKSNGKVRSEASKKQIFRKMKKKKTIWGKTKMSYARLEREDEYGKGVYHDTEELNENKPENQE